MSLSLAAHTAYADPIRSVTSGGAYQIPEDGETGWDVFGTNFWFGGDALNVQGTLTCGYPCTSGTTMNLSTTMRPYAGGGASFDGQTFDSVFYTGDFAFSAGSVTVPDSVPSWGMRPGPTTPFTFKGTLAGYADQALTMPLFSTQLAGSGLANVAFFSTPSGGVYADGFDFNFTNVAATPEPASLILLGTGAGLIALKRRRTTMVA